MKYELMVKAKEQTVKTLSEILKLESVEPKTIVTELEQLNYEDQGEKNDVYNKVNLLHKNHITDGRHGSWKNNLSKKFIEQIEEKYRDWLVNNDYSISTNLCSEVETHQEYSCQYIKWVETSFPELAVSSLALFKSAKQTDWENPTTPIELNNFAVVNIIEAENTDGTSLRQFYLDLAIEALETALSLENNPLCVAHLGIIKNLLGENNIDYNIYYSNLLDLLPLIFTQPNSSPAGFVYLPIRLRNQAKNKEILQKIISLDNGYLQAFYLLIADLEQCQLFFNNPWGLRLVNLANQILPDSAEIKLSLGISSIFNKQLEGLLYLYQAGHS